MGRSHQEQEKKEWDKELEAYRGNYRGIVKFRRRHCCSSSRRSGAVLFGMIFVAMGRMLIGMGLMKLGVFSGERSRGFYIGMVVLGYGIGLPLMVFDALELIRHRFSDDYGLHGGKFYQLLRQRGRGPGPCGLADADCEERRTRLAYQAAGRRGKNGAFQLSDSFDRLHDPLLRLRLRAFRARSIAQGWRGSFIDLGRSAFLQPDLAQALPIRPGRMAVAIADLRASPADVGFANGRSPRLRCRPARNNRLPATKDMLNSTAAREVRRAWNSIRLVPAATEGHDMSTDTTAEPTELEPTVLDTEPSFLPGDGEEKKAVTGPEPRTAPRAEPVTGAQRYYSVDVLRGFALLGILAMNIVSFGWPGVVVRQPDERRWVRGARSSHLVLQPSLLRNEDDDHVLDALRRGAGARWTAGRSAGARIRGVYYRRVLWLLVIGLVHAYLIWSGDILVLYAECGLFLYFFRNLAPRTLIVLGFAALLYLVPILLAISSGIDYTKDYFQHADARVLARQQAGQVPELRDRAAQAVWHGWLAAQFREAPAERSNR